jgi:hypothetical protein
MSISSAGSPKQVHQLKITLKRTEPPIWRRVLVPSHFSLDKLHQVIQSAMGWYNCHMHQFTIHREAYSTPSPYDWGPVKDERLYSLNDIAPKEKRQFSYEYDFGDSWSHQIVVEKIFVPETELEHPVCLAGKRACPPEDVGGTWGYYEYLEAINDPTHEKHEEYLNWIGVKVDPERFDLEGINRSLARIT